MAEVMQPLAPPPPVSMLHSRTPSSDSYQQPSPPQSAYSHGQRKSHHAASPQHRATTTAPIQPYAFQSTPPLRQDSRASPSMSATQKQGSGQGSSGSTTSRSGSGEDLNTSARVDQIINLSSSIPDLSLQTFDASPKTSPDRYRRPSSSKKVETAPVSGMPPRVGTSTIAAAPAADPMHIAPPPPRAVHHRTASNDSTASAQATEAVKRHKHRSMAGIEATARQPAMSYAQVAQRPASSYTPVTHHQASSSARHGSRDSTKAPPSIGTSYSDKLDMSKPLPPSPGRHTHSRDSSPARSLRRGSSETTKASQVPSPLSMSAVSGEGAHGKISNDPPRSPEKFSSPAAQHLAALSDKDLNKGMKSRLRRAFSFGSAAELRKSSYTRPPIENVTPAPSHVSAQDAISSELDTEQQEIIRRQEAAGIGAGIYHGQGGFSGSSDNLSVSSTASSASVMLRKMGKGMRKGGRSLKGLFRPKSVVGVPSADGPISPSLAEVSLVTVEAERARVNVNVTVADQHGGGTGFPKLERNSMEVPLSPDSRSSADRNDSLRKSIVGSEKDRAEVLAAVKKGILKRAGTSSPIGSPIIRPQTAPSREDPSVAGSPGVSMPGTPKEKQKSRSLSSTTSSNDYFSTRVAAGARSMPATPQSNRNISFSPRIQFHDVWSSTEYDRRGEIATANRLTPMLAQQIKEELNTFKMEMEVHELSKPHTHFF